MNPELFSFAKKPCISLASVLACNSTFTLFNLPLSVEAFNQFQNLQQCIQDQQQAVGIDVWKYIWGSNVFTSRKAYKQLMGTNSAHPIFKWIWKSSCQPKHKVFFWLIAQDRLSTRNILRRKHMHLPSYNCVLCPSNLEESSVHLFLDCAFAKTCWGLLGLTVISSPDCFQKLISFRDQLNVRFFMEVIILMCWSIWIVRNDLIFRGIPPDCLRCLHLFIGFFEQLLWRARRKYFPSIEQWLDQVV